MATKSKNNSTVWIIAGVAGAALITIVAAWHFLIPTKAAAKNTGGGTKTPAPPSPPSDGGNNNKKNNAPSYASGYPLKIGSKNNNVKVLQQALSDLGANLVLDGIFGVLTQAALIQATGIATVDSPSALQNIVDRGNAMASTPNYQGNMLSNPNYVPPTPDSDVQAFYEYQSGK